MTRILAIHRCPAEAPERFALVAWDCERGAAPVIGDVTYAATVEVARAAVPPGWKLRAPRAPARRTPTGKPRRRRRARPAPADLWLPGPFPPPDEDITPPPGPARARAAEPDSVIEVWEGPA